MAKDTAENQIRLRDWILLIFVLVAMGLLISDIGVNVRDIIDRNPEPASVTPAPAVSYSPTRTILCTDVGS